jgi:hypothetical protein
MDNDHEKEDYELSRTLLEIVRPRLKGDKAANHRTLDTLLDLWADLATEQCEDHGGSVRDFAGTSFDRVRKFMPVP